MFPDALLTQITEAFKRQKPTSWVVDPTKDLVVSELIGKRKRLKVTKMEDEVNRAIRQFTPVRWQDLPTAVAEKHIDRQVACDALSFFNAEALAYYLPGYMMGVIKSKEFQEEYLSSVVFVLTLNKDKRDLELARWREQRLSLFNAKEIAAIRDFLLYCQEHFLPPPMYEGFEEYNPFAEPIAQWTQRLKECQA